VLQHNTFPHVISVSSKFPNVLLGVGGYEERKCWANCPTVQLVSKISILYVILIHKCHRQTTCYRRTALCAIIHRAVTFDDGPIKFGYVHYKSPKVTCSKTTPVMLMFAFSKLKLCINLSISLNRLDYLDSLCVHRVLMCAEKPDCF